MIAAIVVFVCIFFIFITNIYIVIVKDSKFIHCNYKDLKAFLYLLNRK